ncbi:MAG: acyloxyacyl hydrolase, partial [Perlabentimonas sp.]
MAKIFRISFHVVFLVLFPLASSFSSNTEPKALQKTLFQVGYHRGVLFPHHSYIEFFNEDFINAFELRLGRTLPNIRYPKPPTIGFGAYYSNLANKDIYGSATAAYVYFDSQFTDDEKFFSIGSSIATGISFTNKPYHKHYNPFNQAIGSHLNAFIILSLNLNFSYNSDFMMSLSPSLIHKSNGRIKLPNSGLNFHTLKLSATYSINNKKVQLTGNDNFAPSKTRSSLVGVISGGIREENKRNPVKQIISSVVVEYYRKLFATGRIGAGGDLFYYSPYLSSSAVENDFKPIAVGGHVSYEILWERLSFILQPGIQQRVDNQGGLRNFSRVGIRYRLNNNLLFNF